MVEKNPIPKFHLVPCCAPYLASRIKLLSIDLFRHLYTPNCHILLCRSSDNSCRPNDIVKPLAQPRTRPLKIIHMLWQHITRQILLITSVMFLNILDMHVQCSFAQHKPSDLLRSRITLVLDQLNYFMIPFLNFPDASIDHN